MVNLLLVATAILALETSRLAWHAQDDRWTFRVIHAVMAALLAATQELLLAPVAVLSVTASFLTLDLKRRNHPVGVIFSGLSSLPWEAGGLIWLGWPEGITATWPRGELLAGLPIAYLCGWIWNHFRPAHWKKSRWQRLYP